MKKILRRSPQHELELFRRNHIDPSSRSKDMKIKKILWIGKGLWIAGEREKKKKRRGGGHLQRNDDACHQQKPGQTVVNQTVGQTDPTSNCVKRSVRATYDWHLFPRVAGVWSTREGA